MSLLCQHLDAQDVFFPPHFVSVEQLQQFSLVLSAIHLGHLGSMEFREEVKSKFKGLQTLSLLIR